MENVNLLEIPFEVFVYHISHYFDHRTMNKFLNGCRFFRQMGEKIEREREKIQLKKIELGRKRYSEMKKNWMEKRLSLSLSERETLDVKFVKHIRKLEHLRRSYTSTRSGKVKEINNFLREVYSKGGSGLKVAKDEPHNLIHSARKIFLSVSAKEARYFLENLKIQIDSQVTLKSELNVQNRVFLIEARTIEGIFVNSIVEGIFTKKIDLDDNHELIEIVLESLRLFRNAGMDFLNESFHLQLFILEIARKMEIIPKDGKQERRNRAWLERVKTASIKFVRFMIEENGCDPFLLKDVVYSEKSCVYLQAMRSKHTLFLVPYIFNPYKICRNPKSQKFMEFVEIFSIFLNEYLNQMLSSPKSRKILERILSITPLRKSLMNKNTSFVFDFVRRKERGLVSFMMRKEKKRLKMLRGPCKKKGQYGNTLLHVLCGTRGKIEQMLLQMLRRDYDVNSTNSNDETPIFKAIEIRQWKAIVILVKNGADLDCLDKNGRSPRFLVSQDKWLMKKLGDKFPQNENFQLTD